LTDEAIDFLETIFDEFDGDFVCHASPQSFLGIISTDFIVTQFAN